MDGHDGSECAIGRAERREALHELAEELSGLARSVGAYRSLTAEFESALLRRLDGLTLAVERSLRDRLRVRRLEDRSHYGAVRYEAALGMIAEASAEEEAKLGSDRLDELAAEWIREEFCSCLSDGIREGLSEYLKLRSLLDSRGLKDLASAKEYFDRADAIADREAAAQLNDYYGRRGI